jgi:hypothetical protein
VVSYIVVAVTKILIARNGLGIGESLRGIASVHSGATTAAAAIAVSVAAAITRIF